MSSMLEIKWLWAKDWISCCKYMYHLVDRNRTFSFIVVWQCLRFWLFVSLTLWYNLFIGTRSLFWGVIYNGFVICEKEKTATYFLFILIVPINVIVLFNTNSNKDLYAVKTFSHVLLLHWWDLKLHGYSDFLLSLCPMGFLLLNIRGQVKINVRNSSIFINFIAISNELFMAVIFAHAYLLIPVMNCYCLRHMCYAK